ncbi:MAG TPA: acyl-CoA dehydrogenase family protein [Verrucomicrobiae bacterium]|nr:acyl-CoA dehydrogenase family protein [Verrucomicrobiae bacterium]
MDLEFTPEQKTFRDEVRAFLRANLPKDLSDKIVHGKRMGRNDLLLWHKILHKQGWVAPTWPREFGGTGWSSTQQYIFEEECAAAGAPPLMPFGLRMVAPVIMKFGSPGQQQHFLPRILSGEDWWCQGYSEPGSGSDLASLKTRAERQGDYYLVNGQKTWTTLAQHADWIFCLVRTATDVRAQEGISFLLIDMKSPGITVRPIIMLDGEHEINEVWFENVKVPVANRVGEENKGWTYAKYLLGHERTGNAGVGFCKRWLEKLKRIAAEQGVLEDARFRDKVAQVEIDLMALEITNLRVIAAEAEKKGPGPEASMLKVKGTEIQQMLTELMMQALGVHALPWQPAALDHGYAGEIAGPAFGPPLTGDYFNFRKASIYAGSNEIQRNIISKMMLGL